MATPPKSMFRKSSNHFDRDLDEILDRVYGSTPNTGSDFDTNAVTTRQLLERREQGSIELKQALAELRDRREKSQTVLRMKEEVDYLQDQINQLRELGEKIAVLRKKLSEEGE